MGRKPRSDDFEDLDSFQERPVENFSEDGTAKEEESEEVDFDKMDFEKGEMWKDYAEDMDFEDN